MATNKKFQFKNDYDITKLFLTKDVAAILSPSLSTIVHIPTIKDLYLSNDINYGLSLLFANHFNIQKIIPFWKVDSVFAAIKVILFQAAMYKEYRFVAEALEKTINYCFPQLDINKSNHTITVESALLDNEIWDYLVYILRLGCGEKIENTPKSDSLATKKWAETLEEKEERVKAIRARGKGDKEALIKSFLRITNAFPQFSFDYLFDQTVAQIQWLEGYAASKVSYDLKSAAFAAGNMKKGSKLDFFIK